jgi:hypothetical protein
MPAVIPGANRFSPAVIARYFSPEAHFSCWLINSQEFRAINTPRRTDIPEMSPHGKSGPPSVCSPARPRVRYRFPRSGHSVSAPPSRRNSRIPIRNARLSGDSGGPGRERGNRGRRRGHRRRRPGRRPPGRKKITPPLEEATASDDRTKAHLDCCSTVERVWLTQRR